MFNNYILCKGNHKLNLIYVISLFTWCNIVTKVYFKQSTKSHHSLKSLGINVHEMWSSWQILSEIWVQAVSVFSAFMPKANSELRDSYGSPSEGLRKLPAGNSCAVLCWTVFFSWKSPMESHQEDSEAEKHDLASSWVP